MAHRKAGGTAKNLRDSNAQYLGVKITDGEKVGIGMVIVRQRGTKVIPGKNVGLGKDHTLFALKAGTVAFGDTRKTDFTGKISRHKKVDIILPA